MFFHHVFDFEEGFNIYIYSLMHVLDKIMDVARIRSDFPVLRRKIDGKPVIYLDSACMTLKPTQVIEAMNEYYHSFPACGGRSAHKLGVEVTMKYEESREKIRRFINAKKPGEVIFTKNTTESINLVARSLKLKKGDVVLISDKEHNSNLVPWQVQKKQKGVDLQLVRSNDDNTFNLELFEELMNKKVKLVSMGHISNFDGYMIPAREIIKIAHDYDALVMLDGAQSAPRTSIDVQKLDVDLFAFSFHKMLGPTGMGALYGKYHILDEFDPFIVGGNTVETTSYRSFTLLKSPERFEAGLQNYAGALGAGAAVDFITDIGMENIERHVHELNSFLTDRLKAKSEVSILGPIDPRLRSGIISFNIEGKDPHDVAMHLDNSNIMVRSGVFCAHSWFKAHNVKGAVRVSLYLYNTKEECEVLSEEIDEIIR
jgi:cysteine desulfurase/selenocysteine lyase